MPRISFDRVINRIRYRAIVDIYSILEGGEWLLDDNTDDFVGLCYACGEIVHSSSEWRYADKNPRKDGYCVKCYHEELKRRRNAVEPIWKMAAISGLLDVKNPYQIWEFVGKGCPPNYPDFPYIWAIDKITTKYNAICRVSMYVMNRRDPMRREWCKEFFKISRNMKTEDELMDFLRFHIEGKSSKYKATMRKSMGFPNPYMTTPETAWFVDMDGKHNSTVKKCELSDLDDD